MSLDRKLRFAFVVVPVGIAIVSAVLAAHGVSHPLDPIGVGPD